jgi:hypothetical protein
MKNQKFNPLEVKLVNNQLVLVRNIQVVQQNEIGSFADRYELGNKVREMGFKNVKFSEDALRFIDVDVARIKAEKAEIRNAKKLARTEAKAIKLAERTAKAEARAVAKAAKLEAKATKLAEREQRKAVKLQAKNDKLVARQLNKDAKLAAKAERARLKAEAKPKAKATKFEATIGSDGIERGVARRSDAFVEELV